MHYVNHKIKKIHEIMLEQEMEVTGLSEAEIYAHMDKKFTNNGKMP
ncbi:L-serine deaminase alpha subunit [Staphylococcus gallinarum]|uniref:L-serine deaminase alpha subunit n=1 Tax=Staphylococcus gallinarum TaxID=1293 RepID=A0A380FGI6_STAGA|nr:L-serine deaminase alpha subunit [Staphylococcus gallinarum]